MNDPEPMHKGELNERQRRFVEEMARGLSTQQAATSAGYSPAYARKSSRLLKQPMIAKAIAEIREKGRTLAAYRLAEAMAEAYDAAAFAKANKNSMALVKACELRAKLSGLLVDRMEVVTLDLSSALQDARTRVIDVHTITPGQKLALASATLTTVSTPTNSTENGEKKWEPFSQ